MIDDKQEDSLTKQNQDHSNHRFTISQFKFNNTVGGKSKSASISLTSKFTSGMKTSTLQKCKNIRNKIYTMRKNKAEFAKDDHNHIIFSAEKGAADVKTNMFLTWRERHNKLIATNNRDGIVQDILKKIKSAQFKSEQKLPFLSYEDQSMPKIKPRWQSSKQIQTPIELISRKLECQRVKSQRPSKKTIQMKFLQKPILLSKFMETNKQKSCILRISGWQANYAGFQQYNL